MAEFVLLDAAIWQAAPQFDALTRTANAVPLYADLPSTNASQFGPWLLEADAFKACLPGDEACEVPWRYGISRLVTDANLATLAMHLESQRSIEMEEGDRYYLRYADTRALDTLSRVLTPDQVRQLKGPVGHWLYVGRLGESREFGAGIPADPRRHPVIVLAGEQNTRFLELQLAVALAGELATSGIDPADSTLSAEQYRHVEAAVAFVLLHGIEPIEVQRHIAAIAIETEGAVFADSRFLAKVELSKASEQWHELMKWLAV
ncbi:hypothetical protein LMG28688_05739 [Paraburkholderia caffeinitolerans]|uniref:DUF4123 domain-containing protein n=1 Tax=Paraburkholderia caffeinitolerans TaxID=1723730 RepID=A0A6J5GQ42_9BURK|nr:DUF4123 domain-containing protein [Paraburkholderia caffeinitolerans]CAB3803283.1 hypothetical protein LMG28688_05739 [Paraburkholderia caffeinitolerans]